MPLVKIMIESDVKMKLEYFEIPKGSHTFLVTQYKVMWYLRV